MSYIPLNVKSEYTFLSSAIRIDKYVSEAKKLGFSMLGISDIENCYSFPSFVKECNKHSIKPILGVELNINYKSNKRVINLFIKNEEGYHNLCEILSNYSSVNFEQNKYKTDGLILIIPSLTGNWFNFPFNNQEQRNFLYDIQKQFKEFYIGSECYQKEDIAYLNLIYKFADDSNFKTIAFPKTIALNKNDGLTINILDAIKNSYSLNSTDSVTTPHFLLSENAAKKIYRKEDFLPFETIEIDFNLFQKRGKILSQQGIENKKEDLYEKCIAGLKNKNVNINDDVVNRLNYELTTIENMKYLDYFYIVKNYVNYAKNNGISVGPGRGSAAGSLVSYALNITDVNPFDYDLLFERFLNPERITMPDIDVDFSDYRRDDVIEHIANLYGRNRVKNIITFQTIGAKQAIRDIGRVFSLNNSDINTLCGAIKNSTTFVDAYKNSKKFRELIENSHFKGIASLARKIEGFPRQKGLHAAGIIINDEPLNKVLPIIGDDFAPAPFEAPYLEELNFLKMDILGLRNLSLIENILNKIPDKFDISKIKLDDQNTFDVLNKGFTKGVFQLESDGITNALQKVNVDSFADIVAINALYRPGPMDNIPSYANRKKGLEPIKYEDDRLEPILKDTFGIIVYQEQIMMIALKIASFSLGKADILRRAISKKDEAKLKVMEKEFIEGAIKNNITREKAQQIYNYIYKFADYGFNKSHSVSYSYISYQLAYLKANYPAYFYATMLENAGSSSAKYMPYFNELNYFNIKLLRPDINLSTNTYKIENNSIRLPINGIISLASNIANTIINKRNENGPYKSYSDVIIRLSKNSIDKNTFLLLINSGALDSFNINRNTMRNNLDNYILFAESLSINEKYTSEELSFMQPILKEYKDNEFDNYKAELKALGILLSGSLFKGYDRYFKDININSIEDAIKSENKRLFVPMIISSIRIINTKDNKEMAIMECYDDKNTIKVIVFPKNYENIPQVFVGDAILANGYYHTDEIGSSFVIETITKMEVEHE